jgi:hypothetical protein
MTAAEIASLAPSSTNQCQRASQARTPNNGPELPLTILDWSSNNLNTREANRWQDGLTLGRWPSSSWAAAEDCSGPMTPAALAVKQPQEATQRRPRCNANAR